MSISDFIKLYGTRTVSATLRKLADDIDVVGNDAVIIATMADQLQEALENYASEDFEPPTVNNEVV
jgi:hypothetical protein